MLTSDDTNAFYPDRIRSIGIELLEPFKGSKIHHKMKCIKCAHEWEATPISKIQNFKKWGKGGCPMCTALDKQVTKNQVRASNISKLSSRGLVVLSDWDGTTGAGARSVALAVTIYNTTCGHTFVSNSKNLLNRHVECPICAKQYKTNLINASSERRSAKWKQTATDWQKYKSIVVKLTRLAYKANKSTINPNNYPQGKAGVEGAYHIDHIVPIRYCFNNNIPAEICAHPTNLQMLGWRDNVGSRDKLKNGRVPVIFETLMAIQQ